MSRWPRRSWVSRRSCLPREAPSRTCGAPDAYSSRPWCPSGRRPPAQGSGTTRSARSSRWASWSCRRVVTSAYRTPASRRSSGSRWLRQARPCAASCPAGTASQWSGCQPAASRYLSLSHTPSSTIGSRCGSGLRPRLQAGSLTAAHWQDLVASAQPLVRGRHCFPFTKPTGRSRMAYPRASRAPAGRRRGRPRPHWKPTCLRPPADLALLGHLGIRSASRCR